ncbi:hypothetical cyanophage protein [Synechococcus phage S-CRM01]|uniref:hypothetical cyanophage protein n=1 Tax=Synechococcus phage S-CRM01 TaxID=1026955 RepID=UPI000209E401|nr:hypothetical cyanophage protein [Synechococcus phage S-CRM01]AEC53122.1 hypothetical cyanophage protein [Synechococcus phage S-CRM01]
MLFQPKYINPLEKLSAGWWWVGQTIEEWFRTMMSEDGEFFNYLNSDYVGYLEEMNRM